MGVSPEEERGLGFEGTEVLNRGSSLLVGQSVALFKELSLLFPAVKKAERTGIKDRTEPSGLC